MTDSYFRVLFRCMIFSMILLIATSALVLPPWSTIAAGGLPLVYYHLFYLKPRAEKGLSANAIDSVYYFGFLITIAALGISAVSIARSGASENVNTVIYQFGVGLFATGYAVLARMHLTSISVKITEASPEAVMDRYLSRSMDLLDNVEMAVSRVAEFSRSIVPDSTQVADSVRASTEKAMLEVAQTFNREMSSALGTIKDSVIDVRNLISDTSFIAERQAFLRTVKASTDVAALLNKSLEQYAISARNAAEATNASVASTLSFEGRLKQLDESLGKLAGPGGSMTTTVTSLVSAGQSIVGGTAVLERSVEQLSEMSKSTVDAGAAMRGLRTHAKKANEQLELLSGVIERLDQTLASVVATSGATNTLATELSKVSQTLPHLSAAAELLGSKFSNASKASDVLETHLSHFPQYSAGMGTLATEVSSSLDMIANSISRAAASSEGLKANTAGAEKVIEGAGQLLASAGNLQSTVASLEQLMAGLSSSIRSIQGAFTDTSDELRTSMSASTKLLENDVRRSSEAASMLTNRLVLVAQTIIDQTRKVQGGSL